jgi:hypothetical protein
MKSDLPDRSFKFALEIVKLCKYLQKNIDASYEIIKQLLRAGTSVGSNMKKARVVRVKRIF